MSDSNWDNICLGITLNYKKITLYFNPGMIEVIETIIIKIIVPFIKFFILIKFYIN
jgi:hypothetical protein